MQNKESERKKIGTKRIAIWAEHPFQLYSVVEFIRINKHVLPSDLFIVTEAKNATLLFENEILQNLTPIFIDDLTKKWHSYFRLVFEATFVSKDFSSVYAYNNSITRQAFPLLAALQQLSFLKLPRNRINLIFSTLSHRLGKLIYRKAIVFDTIYCFTKVYHSVLLNMISKERIAVMESWDHPMKFPFLFQANEAYTWNKFLKEDIGKFQGLSQIKQIKPLKFHYIDRFKHLTLNEIENILSTTTYRNDIIELQEKSIVLYPTTTSSNGIEHEGEMKLINSLCKAFKGSQHFLYIKPKPNGPIGDYDIFKTRPQVVVGRYSSNFDSRDMLDDSYHLFRYYLIKKSFTSINAGTTFGLEIAYADKPLIQLDVTHDFHPGFSEFIHTYHLSKYLLSLPGTISFAENSTDILATEIKERNMEFSCNLKNWLLKW